MVHVCHLFVAHLPVRNLFQAVYPTISHAVGKLFFLSPDHLFGQVILKCLPKDVFFYFAVSCHLVFWIEPHGYVQELLVEKGNTSLHPPRGERLVCTQAVVLIQFAQLPDSLLMKLFRIGRLMEVEISSKNFVGTFAGEYHFHAHRFDIAGNQVHGCTGTHRCHVVGLNVIDHITNGVKAFLHGKFYLVMDGADVSGHFSG